MSNQRKILFLSPYPVNKAPSQRLKFEQYYPQFKESGLLVSTSSFIDSGFWNIIYKKGNYLKKTLFTVKGYLRRIRDVIKIRQYDVVYVHLWVVPFGPPIFEWLIGKLAKRLIYDIDDLIFLKPKSKSSPIVNLFKSGNNSIQLMKMANHVITCTPTLDEFVRNYNLSTTDISSTVNTDIYLPVNHYESNNNLVIGWSGSHSTVQYLHLLDPVFKRLSKDFPFKLKVIGTDNYDLEGVEIEASEWVESTEVEELQKIDIGVYPLPEEQWVYGKSGLKAIQYMALGIPTVATDIGTIKRIIDHKINGLLVKSDQEWYESLKMLLKDEYLRKSIGKMARDTIVKKFSVKATADQYLKIING